MLFNNIVGSICIFVLYFTADINSFNIFTIKQFVFSPVLIRYNQIIHMVSAANGAEEFYSTEEHACRSEGVELARELDYKAAAAWVGHPYFDVIDNSQDFESKICRMIECVCQKLGIDTGDRLRASSRKVKFLVTAPLPVDSEFPPFQDFDVVHNYLQSNNPKMQARLRKRGQKGKLLPCDRRKTLVSFRDPIVHKAHYHLKERSLLLLSWENLIILCKYL